MADKKEDAAAAAFESSAFGTTRIHAACVCIYRGRAREHPGWEEVVVVGLLALSAFATERTRAVSATACSWGRGGDMGGTGVLRDRGVLFPCCYPSMERAMADGRVLGLLGVVCAPARYARALYGRDICSQAAQGGGWLYRGG